VAGAATGLAEQAVAALELLLLPQPARLAAATRITPATAGRFTKHLIEIAAWRLRPLRPGRKRRFTSPEMSVPDLQRDHMSRLESTSFRAMEDVN
jgi:hypothetical protein